MDLLIKICILSSIIGILLLVFTADKVENKNIQISSISNKDIGKNVKFSGKVIEFSTNKDTSRFNIQDKSGEIGVTLFKSPKLQIRRGSLVEVQGKVSLYQNNLQINGETVKILNNQHYK